MKYYNNETKQTIDVIEHIVTRNFWEFYIIEKLDDDRAFALVHGHETEMGYVSMKEISPHIISRTSELEELFPPIGWVKKEDDK